LPVFGTIYLRPKAASSLFISGDEVGTCIRVCSILYGFKRPTRNFISSDDPNLKVTNVFTDAPLTEIFRQDSVVTLHLPENELAGLHLDHRLCTRGVEVVVVNVARQPRQVRFSFTLSFSPRFSSGLCLPIQNIRVRVVSREGCHMYTIRYEPTIFIRHLGHLNLGYPASKRRLLSPGLYAYG
jgi:hypothetical protein